MFDLLSLKRFIAQNVRRSTKLVFYNKLNQIKYFSFPFHGVNTKVNTLEVSINSQSTCKDD